MNYEDKKDEVILAIEDMQQAMGELRQAWDCFKSLTNYSDPYIEQEISEDYSNGLAQMINDLMENVDDIIENEEEE